MTIQSQSDTYASIRKLVDQFLAGGLCHGTGDGKEVCVMQAINLAERGLSSGAGVRDITDSATCVSRAATSFAIRMNDSAWTSPEARAKGLHKLAHALIGSVGIDEVAWVRSVGHRYIKDILPIALRALAEYPLHAKSKDELLAAADRCEREGTIESARAAQTAARQARDRAAADAVAVAVAAAVADADAAAVAAAAADAVAVAVAAAVADADAAAVAAAVADAAAAAWWRFYAKPSPKRDEILTRCADIAAEELELAKAARDAQ